MIERIGNPVLYNPFSKDVDTLPQERQLLIGISILYFSAWFIEYLDFPSAIRWLFGLSLLALQFRSFYLSTIIVFAFIFFPFFKDIITLPISGLNTTRLMFLPFIYLGFQIKPQRLLKVNKILIFFILLSLISILLSAEVRKLVQEIPLIESKENSPGFLNFVARSVDVLFILIFIYLLLTRLGLKQIEKLMDILILFGLLEALCIIFLVAQNPQSVFLGEGFDKSYLWRNPFFGHKNDWGMVLAFLVLLTYMRMGMVKSHKILYTSALSIIAMAVLLSLSRQAYINVILGFLLFSVFQGNIKPSIYFSIGLLLVIIIQPTFLINRITSFQDVSNIDQFQNISRKVSGLALNQFIDNLTIIPNIFYKSHEYNWSEGFWNGLAHQQGVIGIFFHICFYFFAIYRYYLIGKTPIKELGILGIMMTTFFIIIFISLYNRRGIHIMHYDGKIEQFGFIFLLLISMSEFWIYHYKKLITSSKETK